VTSTSPSGKRTATATLSLREIGGRIVRHFWHSIRRLSDPFTFRLIGSVMRGRSPSLLELEDRPAEYEDVGGCACGMICSRRRSWSDRATNVC
jgi:hypothetical protein